MSAAPDMTLADLQQANADLQRQLAERSAERDEGLAREGAMAEVLGVINSSSGGLADARQGDTAVRCGPGLPAHLRRERVPFCRGPRRPEVLRKRPFGLARSFRDRGIRWSP
jgi:hypothetical protein